MGQSIASLIYKDLAPLVSSFGFKRDVKQSYRRDRGDVRHYIGVRNNARPAMRGSTEILVQCCVFSKPLELKSPRYPGQDLDWEHSRIRANLPDLAGAPLDAYSSRVYRFIDDADFVRNSAEIREALIKFGIPFLDSMNSTDEMIPVLRTGRYSLGRPRSNYDADVWEGKIDPLIHPFSAG